MGLEIGQSARALEQAGQGSDILWGISAIHVVEALLLILVVFVGLVTGGQTEGVGLALLLLADRRSIRLLMLGRWRVGGALVLVVVAAAVLVAAKLLPRLGLMEAAAAVMVRTVARMAVE